MFYLFISHNSKILEHYNTISKIMFALNHSDYGIFYGGTNSNINNNHIIHIDCDDTYEGLPNKIHNICKYISQNSKFNKFSHFCKIDATTPIESLVPIISDQNYYGIILNQHNDYANRAWHFNKWNNKLYEGIFIPYCVGDGYVLSKKSVQCVANQPDDPDTDIYEDLYVSQKLHNCTIYPYYYDTKQHLVNREW